MIPAKGFRVRIASSGRISSLDDGVWYKRRLLTYLTLHSLHRIGNARVDTYQRPGSTESVINCIAHSFSSTFY